MKLLELFLSETTEEDRSIISLANTLYDHVKKYIDYIDPESTEPVDTGKIGDFFEPPIEGFRDIHIKYQQGEALGRAVAKHNQEEYEEGKNPRGVWFAEDPSITLNADYLVSERMRSTIAHELRHALDDLKSEGRAGTSKRYDTPKKKIHQKRDPYQKNYPYLAKPAEINARFVQVLDGISDAISKQPNLPPDQLSDHAFKALKRLFIQHNIVDLFPEKAASKDYKRLVKRAVDFIQKEVAYVSSL